MGNALLLKAEFRHPLHPLQKLKFSSYTYCSCLVLLLRHFPVQGSRAVLSRDGSSVVFLSRCQHVYLLLAVLQLDSYCACACPTAFCEWSHSFLGPVACPRGLPGKTSTWIVTVIQPDVIAGTCQNQGTHPPKIKSVKTYRGAGDRQAECPF